MSADIFALVGAVIDNRYRIDSVVGEGGFGVVYRGWHLAFGHHIAVKCLKVPVHFTSGAKAMFLAQFRGEGVFLSKLSAHPAIVRVFDLNVIEKAAGQMVPYLVLEWLDGMDLEGLLQERRRCRAQPMSEAESVGLLRPVVEALALAHELKIVHRDLKPRNLYLTRTRSGTALKVLDFGIAKAMQEGETATRLATGTSSDLRAFTPDYGAPEQFVANRFGPTGPWTDVHALGLILTELVLGRRVYGGDALFEFYEEATSAKRPTPRAKGARVSDAFEALCAKALRANAAERFQDASQLLAALDRCQQPPAPGQVPPDKAQPTITEFVAAPIGIESPPVEAVRKAMELGTSSHYWAASGTPTFELGRTLEPQFELAGVSSPPFESARIPPSPGRSQRNSKPPVAWFVVIGGLVVSTAAIAWFFWGGGEEPAPGGATAASATAAGAPAVTVPKPETDRMVRVPAGTFMMGSNEGNPDEKPLHSVTVASFAMDLTEVTVKAYQTCVTAGACQPRRMVLSDWYEKNGGAEKWSRACNYGQTDRAEHPMNCVDWPDAERFCKWAGKRLPTEEEWEYAARGTANREFPWGSDAPCASRLNACGAECVSWIKRNVGLSFRAMYSDSDSWPTTAPVGRFPSGDSPFGLHDMAGNVWEWTATNHCSYGHSACSAVSRVNRGGSWGDADPLDVSGARRSGSPPSIRDGNLGFRCAR